MEFYCGTGLKRPVRLSEETRAFAWRSLHGEFGDDTCKVMDVSMDGIQGFAELDDDEKYSLCIEAIAQQAPLRLIEGEKICGAATLGRAINHYIPAVYKGQNTFYSVSHLTLDFATVLKTGINGIKENVEKNVPHPCVNIC